MAFARHRSWCPAVATLHPVPGHRQLREFLAVLTVAVGGPFFITRP